MILEHRKFVIVAFVVSSFLVVSDTARATETCTDDGSGPYESPLNADEFNQAVQALPAAAFLTPRIQPPLPSHAYLNNLPAVSEQGTAAHLGSPGSCEALSFGYGLGSYTAARLPNGSHKWIAALPENSAEFVEE